MNTLWVALAGAALGGLVQSLLRAWERRTVRQATYIALTTEIRLLCGAARREGLYERYDGAARHLGIDPWNRGYVFFPDGMNLTPVFNANVARIGDLKPRHAELIVQFYFWANMVQTIASESGVLMRSSSELVQRRNLAYLAFLSRSMLDAGDRICPPIAARSLARR